jgi:hypothetical protein
MTRKSVFYKRAKELGYKGPLSYTTATAAEWLAVVKQLELEAKNPKYVYTFNLQQLFDSGPIHKRLRKHLNLADLSALSYVVRGVVALERKSAAVAIWCKAGNLEPLKWARAEGFKITDEHVRIVVQRGHWDVLKWMRTFYANDNLRHIEYAAAGGHKDYIIKKLKNRRKPPQDINAIAPAILHGKIELAYWLIERGFAITAHCYKHAAARGDTQLLKTLRENDRNGNSYYLEMFIGASQGGHTNAVAELWRKCSHLLRDTLRRQALVYGVMSGSVEMVKWHIAHKFEKSADAFICAARVGSVEILTLLRDEDCDVTNLAHAAAADKRHHHVTKWLLENEPERCRMDSSVVDKCNKKPKTIKYLRMYGCPGTEQRTDCAL